MPQTTQGILSDEDVKDLRDGKIYFAFYGRAIYVDIFGINHMTEFCRWSPPAVNVAMPTPKCSDYNGVDNNFRRVPALLFSKCARPVDQ